MDKLFIENKLDNFIEYLKEIGLLTKFDISNFKKIFYSLFNVNVYKSDNILIENNCFYSLLDYLSEIIPDVIILFFQSISPQNKKLIALNLYQKYTNKKENILKNKLFNLLFCYNKNKKRFYFTKWKNGRKYPLLNNFSDESLNGLNYLNNSQDFFNLKKNTNIKYYNNINSNNEYPSYFHMLNQYQEFNNNIKSFQRSNLYNIFKDSSNNLAKIKKNPYNNKLNHFFRKNLIERNNTSLYEAINFPVKTKNINNYRYSYNQEEKIIEKEKCKKSGLYNSNEILLKPKLHPYKNKTKKNIGNHEQRINKYNKKKEEKILKISKDLEEEFNKKYTFSPEINKSNIKNKNFSEPKKNSLIPTYERLYQDNKERQKRLKKKIQESIEEIDNRININLMKDENNNEDYFYEKKRNNSGNSRRKINKGIFEELYNDYKKKEGNLNILQLKFDREEGITFNPLLYSKEKYFDKIDKNFLEREKEFLIKQQKNIKVKKNYFDEKSGKKKKQNYTNSKREEIFKDLEERLYKEGVDKYISKKKGNKVKRNNILNKKNIEKNFVNKNVSNNNTNINKYNVSNNKIQENNINKENETENSIDFIMSNNLKDKFI